jgi:hypothetical protein
LDEPLFVPLSTTPWNPACDFKGFDDMPCIGNGKTPFVSTVASVKKRACKNHCDAISRWEANAEKAKTSKDCHACKGTATANGEEYHPHTNNMLCETCGGEGIEWTLVDKGLCHSTGTKPLPLSGMRRLAEKMKRA